MEKIFKSEEYLNEQLPSYAIVRNFEVTELGSPIKLPDEEIPIEYWRNSVDVQMFLDQRYEGLKKSIHSQIDFEYFLKDLHAIQVRGLRGDTFYSGRSNLLIDQGEEREFRSPNNYITASLNPINYKDINFQRGIGKNYNIIYLPFSVVATIRKKEEGLKNTKVLITDTFIPAPIESVSQQYNSEVQHETVAELFGKSIKPNDKRSNIMVYITKELFKSKSDNNLEINKGVIFYPSPKYIPQYLNIMRLNIERMFKADEKDKKLEYLALAYQAGVRGHPFITVNNSLMVGIVNYFLKKELEMSPISHGILDFRALILAPEIFVDYFIDYVKNFPNLDPEFN